MKKHFCKWIMVLALVVFLPMGARNVCAQEVLKLTEMDADIDFKSTDYYSYTYTQEDRITINGVEYAGIAIPMEQAYAGGVRVFIDGSKNITTSDGEVYCALFGDESYSVGEIQKASGEMLDLHESFGETGTRYLVFYNDACEGDSVTTNVQFQAGLYYDSSYEMKENIVYKNYAKDSENSNHAYLKITKSGYYIFESDQDVTLNMTLSGDISVRPAEKMPIVGKTDHKVMIDLGEASEYNLSITSKKGVPYSFTYYYYPPEKLQLTETNSVQVYLGDEISIVAIPYIADKTGIVQVAGVSNTSGQAKLWQNIQHGNRMGYERVISTSPEVTDSSETSFFVRKGESYFILVRATSRQGYVNASFKMTGFVEGDVLGKPTKEEARASKTALEYNTTYYGSFVRDESTTSWIYIDRPCIVHFESYKKNKDEDYTLNYYDGDREVLTTYAQNEHKKIRFLVLEEWVPGFLEINDGAGAGYYSILIEEAVPYVGSVLKDADATYKVTVAADKVKQTDGVVSYMKAANKNAKTVVVPDMVTIDGITYKVASIEKSAFADNKKLTSVTVGNHVTKVGAKAFKGCTNLKKVKLGKNVETIGDRAFDKCGALTKIIIPSKVSKIGKYAFRDCKKLKNITVKTTKLTAKKVGSGEGTG